MKKFPKALAAITLVICIGWGVALAGCSNGSDSPAVTPTPPAAQGATYTVTISDGITNGKVTADKTSGIAAGETITLTIAPDADYELNAISAGSGVALSGTDNTRTFVMPSSNVTITASFRWKWIGTKNPTATKAVGDVVFTDGSASPYAELTDAQKSAAVAVIFDATNKLGVGLDTVSNKVWCLTTAIAYNTDQYATSVSDGNINTNQIKNLNDYSEANYPAFYFAANYSKTGFATGWYLPAKNELQKLYEGKTAVNAAFTALGKETPFSTGQWWWSSSQYDSVAKKANELNFGSGAWATQNCDKYYNSGYVCAVRAFN